MKTIIEKLFAVCTNKRIFRDHKIDRKIGWFGTMFRGLDMTKVVAMKTELEAMVQELGPEFSIKINQVGDKYRVGGVEKEIVVDSVWISRDTREEQTLEDSLLDIPAEYLG